MVGGADTGFAAALPPLQVMGGKVVNCGGPGPGVGQAATICNNMMLGISMIGQSEAIAQGEKLSFTHDKFFDVVSTASGQY